ncbi:hypothetical protein QFC19_003352 [Naganishia cerealis]|uniref:Uncharacterized protein n=1 Tax=Naganishia cerealis TaxID=610337 RepID=A0ACC2W5B4_9TREE|nr:hypothetical protein QFC19_003352 [Naganishia cerealis]
MPEPTPPPLPPPELQPPGEEPYVHAPSLLPMSMLMPPPITISQYSGAIGAMGMGMGMGMGMAMSPPGMSFGAPMILPAHLQEPPRTTPYNQYTIRTSFVTINIPPKTGNSSSLVGGLRRKDASTNVSAIPSETASWAYDPSRQSPPDSDAHEDGDNVDPVQLANTLAAARANTKGGKGGYPRPKTNIRSTNSTFVTRVQSHDGFTKIVPQPPHLENASPASFPRLDGHSRIREGCWYGRWWIRRTRSRIRSCSAPGSADGGRLDMVIGFNTGDLFWLDPITLRYTRLNKAGVIHGRLVIAIRFHPLNPTLIYALFSDGLIMILSTEREDPDFKVTIGQPPWAQRLKAWENGRRRSDSDAGLGVGSGKHDPRQQQQPMFVWRNEEPAPIKGQPAGSPYAGKNPIAVWKIGTKPLKALEFSPDGQAMAVVSDDGTMSIVDPAKASLLDTYAGYFGGLTCLAWSPDGRYVVTGGQDDLVTIISPRESRVVARGQGHASYVTSIAFDRRRSSARSYRFGSVGEDGRVLFNKLLETAVINQIHFLPDSVVTVSKVGNIRFYMRGKATPIVGVEGMTNGVKQLRVSAK